MIRICVCIDICTKLPSHCLFRLFGSTMLPIYIYSISHLAIGSRHQIYYGNRHNHNIVTINQFLSSHDYVNNCTNVSSLYSQIINSCQNVNIVNSNICSIKTKKENQWLTQKVLL